MLLSLDILCLRAIVSITKLLLLQETFFLKPTKFWSGLFIVLREILHQISFALIRLSVKDNAFSLLVAFDLVVLFMRAFYGVFLQYCHHETMNQ